MPTDDSALRRAASALQDNEPWSIKGVALPGFGLGTIDYITDTIELDVTAARLFALPANTALPRQDVHARFHLDCAPRVADAIASALDPSGDGAATVEFRIQRPDQSEIWVLARKQVVFTPGDDDHPSRPAKGIFTVCDITDGKAAEARLRISEIRYRRLFEAAHDGVLLLDPATAKIVDANPFMTKLLGYSHDQLVGKELYEIGLLKDRAMSQEMFRKLTIDQHVRYEDLPLESATGRHREVEVVANLYDENGSPIIQCNIRDITDRKLADAIILQNSRLFATLIEQAPSGVYVIDSAFRLLQINRLAAPTFASVSPLIGRDFQEVLNALWGVESGAKLAKIFLDTLKTGARYSEPAFTAFRADLGTEQTYDWETQRVTLADGSYGVVCYFEDITIRRKAEEEVLAREAHVRSILDNTQAFIGLLAVDGTLLEANLPALKAAGVARDRVIGRKLWTTRWWAGNRLEIARLKDAINRSGRGEVVRYDMVVQIKPGVDMDIDFMIAPVRDVDGVIDLLVPSGLDITERKRSLRHIEMLMGEVNHRAMNLLGVVQAVARQTARDGDPMNFVNRLTERIVSLAASQNLLVQSDWQGVDVADLTAVQLSHYKDLIGTRVRFDGPRATLKPGAAQGIGMALHELATNAGKYGALSNDVGTVQISWELTADLPQLFQMRWTEAGGPPVVPPTRQGFGQKVIGPMVEQAVSGEATIEYRSAGLAWSLSAPVAEALELGRADRLTLHANP